MFCQTCADAFQGRLGLQGCHPVRTAVHNRMLAGQVATQLAQDIRKFFTRAGLGHRRGRILREPFS